MSQTWKQLKSNKIKFYYLRWQFQNETINQIDSKVQKKKKRSNCKKQKLSSTTRSLQGKSHSEQLTIIIHAMELQIEKQEVEINFFSFTSFVKRIGFGVHKKKLKKKNFFNFWHLFKRLSFVCFLWRKIYCVFLPIFK